MSTALVLIVLSILLCSSIGRSSMSGHREKVTCRYRVSGTDDYVMTYIKLANGTYEIHCSKHPHNPRSKDVNVCHLYSNGKVCVSRGKEPRTLDKAKAIGMAFCEGYGSYIRTGVFPNGRKRTNV